MVQQDATKGHIENICVCLFLLCNKTQIQRATFQTNGLRSVHLYVHNTCTLKLGLVANVFRDYNAMVGIGWWYVADVKRD